MFLSGNLSFVPIDEILRLLTRSKQQGSVDVTGNGLRGRVFVGKGGIDLATTSDNTDLHRHLVNSGYADEKTLDRITTGETTLAAIAESNVALIELLREMTVESLYQIADRGGDFQVHEGHTTPYASPKSFDLEALLQDAEERKREWSKVSELVPDLHERITFRRDLGDREEITVKLDDWKVLSEIGNGASVKDIADHLGTTEFWTARVAARLVNSGLVVQAEPTEVPDPSEVVDDDLAPASEPIAQYRETERNPDHQPTAEETPPEPSFDAGPAFEDQPTAETPTAETDEDVDHDESWWEEPTEEDGSVEDSDSEMPTVEDSEDDSDDVEGDTEAFLEKVFSELDSSETEEGEEGHGLLRRRRMGSLRDFSSDS